MSDSMFDTHIMAMLSQSPLIEDAEFAVCVDTHDIPAALERAKVIAEDDGTPLRLRLVAKALPGSVKRIRLVCDGIEKSRDML